MEILKKVTRSVVGSLAAFAVTYLTLIVWGGNSYGEGHYYWYQRWTGEYFALMMSTSVLIGIIVSHGIRAGARNILKRETGVSKGEAWFRSAFALLFVAWIVYAIATEYGYNSAQLFNGVPSAFLLFWMEKRDGKKGKWMSNAYGATLITLLTLFGAYGGPILTAETFGKEFFHLSGETHSATRWYVLGIVTLVTALLQFPPKALYQKVLQLVERAYASVNQRKLAKLKEEEETIEDAIKAALARKSEVQRERVSILRGPGALQGGGLRVAADLHPEDTGELETDEDRAINASRG